MNLGYPLLVKVGPFTEEMGVDCELRRQRIAIVGHTLDYNRTLVIREALENYAEVILIPIPQKVHIIGRTLLAISRLILHFHEIDLVWIPALNESEAIGPIFVSKLLKKPIVHDFLISKYDTLVLDRGISTPRSLKARIAYYLDKLALKGATYTIFDTDEHARWFRTFFNIVPRNSITIPVGANKAVWAQGEKQTYDLNDPPRVIFYGGFSPLHGCDTIIQAAARVPSVRFILIGNGQTLSTIMALTEEMKLTNVEFWGPMPYIKLTEIVSMADIGLGIFGMTNKASRVIPNKVYEMAALGLPIITRESPAITELFSPNNEILLVPPGDPVALSKEIIRLIQCKELRQKIGQLARIKVQERTSKDVIGKQLYESILRGLLSNKR